MIKVLVVDDDKLVRKGLISAMPWQDFGMEVVGEANNGQKALDFLDTQAVDLLLTDLAMPVMSGIELMRIVRSRFPHLQIVVLTLHQDFEYIQEALRLGAIDYIAKVQLEKERFEEVLGRIANRMKEQSNNSPFVAYRDDREIPVFDHKYALLSPDPGADSNWIKELQIPPDHCMAEVNSNSWLWFSREGKESSLYDQLSEAIHTKEDWMLIRLPDLKGYTWKEIHRWVRGFIEKELFYYYDPDNKIVSVFIQEECVKQNEQDDALDILKNQWMTSEWLYNDTLFHKLVNELMQLRLPQGKLIGFLYCLVNEWNRLFAQTNIGKIDLKDSFDFWHQVEGWMNDIRDSLRLSINKSSYSQEILDSIMKAVHIMQAEMNMQLTAAEIAQRMNMSRSYFSQCFKDIIGKTFNEYIRQLRIEKAKEYLLCTSKTIQWIAENTGYMDEKYFSRTFREQTGMLPSEYRQTNRMGR